MGKGSKTWDGGRRWRQWTEREARAALDEFAASGERVADFARGKGVSSQRLAYWRKRLAARGATEFVAVALPTVAASRWIEVMAEGVVVRVREDVDVEYVARLVEAIGRRSSGRC
jgi:hypothetical protein